MGSIYTYETATNKWHVANQRAAIWQINIAGDSTVTLSLVRGISPYETLRVRNGFTHGATDIYFDPLIKSGSTVPNYSVIPQQINTNNTRFDGGGTKFLDFRDSYVIPEQGNSYVVFPHQNVFDN